MRKGPVTPYRNYVLRDAIVEKYGNVAALCRREKAYRLRPNAVGALLRVEESPLHKTGQYRKVCQSLTEILGIPVEQLFPPEIYCDVLPKGVRVGEISFTDLPAELAEQLQRVETTTGQPFSETVQKFLKQKIEQVLSTLNYREREIIKLRFGLADGYTYTLEEVGRIFKITRECVRNVESDALHHLQHPFRSRQLRGFLNELTGIAKRRKKK